MLIFLLLVYIQVTVFYIVLFFWGFKGFPLKHSASVNKIIVA